MSTKEAQELGELWIVRGLCHSTMKGKVLIDCRAAGPNGSIDLLARLLDARHFTTTGALRRERRGLDFDRKAQLQKP